eukprot:COSAG02_NODE_4947_length_4798_cov_54.379017_5_plen_79_part_00
MTGVIALSPAIVVSGTLTSPSEVSTISVVHLPGGGRRAICTNWPAQRAAAHPTLAKFLVWSHPVPRLSVSSLRCVIFE